MSTSYYLVCETHKEFIRTSYHRAIPPPHDDDFAKRVAQFCYRHVGGQCALTVVSEHSHQPFSEEYTEYQVVEPRDRGEVPFADEEVPAKVEEVRDYLEKEVGVHFVFGHQAGPIMVLATTEQPSNYVIVVREYVGGRTLG